MSVVNKLHQLIDFGANAAKYGLKEAVDLDFAWVGKHNILKGNEPINQIGKIGQALMSPMATVGGIVNGRGIKKTLQDVYLDDVFDETGKQVFKQVKNPTTKNIENVAEKSLNIGNIAGSVAGASIGLSVVGGLTHDTSGNVDIAGIPGI